MAVLAVAGSLLTAACGRGKKGQAGGDVGPPWAPPKTASVRGISTADIQAAIQQRLGGARPAGINEDKWRHAKRLYAQFGNAPLWFTDQGLDAARSSALVTALQAADSDALPLDALPLQPLARALTAERETKQPTAAQMAEADVALTAAYAALGEDLLTGWIDPHTVSQDWHIDPREEQIDSALVRTLRDAQLDSGIAAMRPRDPSYEALRKSLSEYQQLAARGGWGTVPKGKLLHPGQSDSPQRLQALRARLAAEGLLADSVAAESPQAVAQGVGGGQVAQSADSAESRAATARAAGRAVYDRQLAGAVAQFQARHGIVVDSALGDETVASMNVPASYRVGQIAANLERFRWLPRSFGARYILVNVPAFRLQAFDDGQPVLEMKVIVGQEYEDKKTPVFSDVMSYVIFRPYWLVTPDIQKKELEPKIAADPNYMAENQYEYYTDHGQQRIRQTPGGKNSLGLVKFMFPNDFNIYLHDTPNGELFRKDVRAFSHGCIRLENPAELAQWVLGWPADKVEQAMHDGPDNHQVNLPRKIPVFITYFTTYARNGQLYFGNDLYHRDDELVQAVADAAMPRAEQIQQLDALRGLMAKK